MKGASQNALSSQMMRDINNMVYSLDTDSDLWEGKEQAHSLKDDIQLNYYLGLRAIPVPPFFLKLFILKP